MHTRSSQSAFICICMALCGLCQPGLAAETAHRTPPGAPAGPQINQAPLAAPAAGSGPSATASATAPAAPIPVVTAPMTAVQVIHVLDQTVDWQRALAMQQLASNEPSDMLFLYDNRQIASNVMRLAIDAARADADMLSREQPAMKDGSATGISAQALLEFKKKLDAQGAAIQADLAARKHELSAATRGSRTDVEAKINDLEGVLDLINTKKQILGSMTEFAAGVGGAGTASLKAQIDAIALAVPAANGSSAAASAPAAASASPGGSGVQSLLGPSAAPSTTIDRLGLWGIAANAFRLSEKSSAIVEIDRHTAALQTTLARIRDPLIKQVKALSARGDALTADVDSSGGAALGGVRDQVEALAVDFKQASALLLPLSRETLLLVQYRRNLVDWRAAIEAQYRDTLRTLGFRVAILAAILTVLFTTASLWRQVVMRYIQESRRRYQLLLLRRIALWSLVVVVIGIFFASELASLVTFAGLITAGLAVAMQSVLVSIVGYFFLIGKYGIRVGDRVQIGEVAGEVIDLGLVRMYLMELGGKGTTGPTGRVVAFANSVAFQVSSGLFKQIPGVNFTWREVALSLPAGCDYAAVKEKLMAAVTDVLKDYRDEILRQTQELERTTSSISARGAEPQVQLHFSASGVEARVRYPVHLKDAAVIDERVTEALARVVSAAAGAAAPARAG